jgi:hypothetical protein
MEEYQTKVAEITETCLQDIAAWHQLVAKYVEDVQHREAKVRERASDGAGLVRKLLSESP